MQSSPRKQSQTTTTPWRRPLIAAMLVIAAVALLGRPEPGFAGLLFTNYTGEVTTTANASDTIGTEFTVGPQDLLMLRLGVYDAAGDGLSFAHQIGVWRVSDQNLLTSVTVPSGTGAALVEDWRFVALAASGLPVCGHHLQDWSPGEQPLRRQPAHGLVPDGRRHRSGDCGERFHTRQFRLS